MQTEWLKRMQKATLFMVFGVLSLGSIALMTAQDQGKAYSELDPQLQPLKDQFNADVGKVRLLLILDPTCPPCRRGASIIQENVMERITTDKLAVYVVWVPLLNFQDAARLQKNARQYAGLLPPGPHVSHYIDPGAYIGKKYGSVLGVPYGAPAWDVYLAFRADERWTDTPPTPSYWEHQLGTMPSEKFLDGPRLAEEVRKLLAKMNQ
jgi:hypothetical protein